MQRLLRSSLFVASILLVPGQSRAGIYNLSELPLWPLPPNFKLVLSELRNSADLPKNVDAPPRDPGPFRASYLKQFDQLDTRRKSKSMLGTLDYVDLSGCMIRLGRIAKKGEAIELLEEYQKEMPADDPARFLIYANLAMAYHLSGEPRRAIDYEEMALDAWPSIWAGWHPLQLATYRRCERYFLSLLRSRNREDAAGTRGRFESVDPLFPRVKFVGAGGQYEAGGIAPRFDDELPLEATEVVLQLIFWLPNDDRLWWLWAEVLNARRNIPLAAEIMIDLVDNRRLGNVQDLFRHRQVLTDAYQTLQAINKTPSFASKLLWTVRPRGGLLAPGVGNEASEALALFPIWYEGQQSPQTSAVRVLPDWRTIVVSFVAGCLVTVLVRLQMSQWRRHFPIHPDAEEETPPGTAIAG
jgi:tetratricopeptide (TPR) repeat protein